MYLSRPSKIGLVIGVMNMLTKGRPARSFLILINNPSNSSSDPEPVDSVLGESELGESIGPELISA